MGGVRWGVGVGRSPIEDQRMCSTDGNINGYFKRIPNGRVSEDEGVGARGERSRVREKG